MAASKTFRRLKMGLQTVLGFKKQGFFIPYRYADQMPARKSYSALEPLFKKAESGFEDIIAMIESHAQPLEMIGENDPPQPRWGQDWFPRLDAAAAYAIVRNFKPARIIEVGSGHSTRFMARAIADGDLDTHFTAIDPAPRATITGLNIDIVTSTLGKLDDNIFSTLSGGDILFIDSSHILMPGSDVDILFNHILPLLPAGVLIHIHDILLPDDYPSEWEWRGYNEQLGVAALLQGQGYRLLFASHYVASRMEHILADGVFNRIEKPDGAFETSVWLRKL